jgi:hypothetical protein
MGIQTLKVYYAYILWVTTDIKVSPSLAKYLLACASSDMLNAELNGVVVRMELKKTEGKRVISEGFTDLEKTSTTQLKDSEIKLPWSQPDVKPTAPGLEDITRRSGNKLDSHSWTIQSIWTDEEPKEYEERLKKLFLKVTGVEVKHFNLVRILPYM